MALESAPRLQNIQLALAGYHFTLISIAVVLPRLNLGAIYPSLFTSWTRNSSTFMEEAVAQIYRMVAEILEVLVMRSK